MQNKIKLFNKDNNDKRATAGRVNMKLGSIFGNNLPEHRYYPAGMVHNFYLYGGIEGPECYVDFITACDTASENELINIYINTPGGDLMGAISIIHAMQRTQATVVAYADGEVASAGSLIFFAAPNKVVMTYAQLMCHDASMFTGGKLSESIKGITATTELVSHIAHTTYYPYFNEDEIEDILEGKDVYCNAKEIYERLERGQAILDANEKEDDGDEPDEPDEIIDLI